MSRTVSRTTLLCPRASRESHVGPAISMSPSKASPRIHETMNKAASHLAIGLIALACQAAVAQSTDPLKDAVQRAISTNPEVTARLNAFRAATDEVDVAKGDRKSTRLNSSHSQQSRMPSSA